MRQYGSNTASVERAEAAIRRWEPTIHAWVSLDLDQARADAVHADQQGQAAVRPMSEITLGIKDIFDTADQPTSYGSPLFDGHQPRADAAPVALLRAAGAISLGKTVTAELACIHPGPTTNPHRVTHTPGGSSMGSAAAVATGMADLALGTQTAGSIIRPASFCGVFGFKPSFGSVSVAGVKPFAPSLDTVGWFARDPELLELAYACLTGRARPADPVPAPRVALARTARWSAASPDSQRAVLAAAQAARDAGALLAEAPANQLPDGLEDAQLTVMSYEGARSLAWERGHPTQLSLALRELLDAGGRLDPATYDEARRQRERGLAGLAGLFGDATVLLTPAVIGEAPTGLGYTGDPLFCRAWTLLGLPAVTIPWTTGDSGLPVGVQLVGRPGADAELLAAARWFADLRPYLVSGILEPQDHSHGG